MYHGERRCCGGEHFREHVSGVHSCQRYLFHRQEIEVYLNRFPQVPKLRAASTFDSQPEDLWMSYPAEF